MGYLGKYERCGEVQEPRGTHPISMTWPMYLRGEVRIGFRTIHLSWNERDMLLILLVHPGWVSTGDLIEHIWPNPDFEPEHAENATKVYASRLRDKGITLISRYARGYMLGDRHRHG